MLRSIDLFSGPGGMSLGAKMAGIKVVLAVDNDPYATETYLHNHPETDFYCYDIRNVPDDIFKKHGKIDIIFGGPPCQGFSTSNQRTRTEKNFKNWYFIDFLRVVSICSPDWIVFENVIGLVETKKGYFYHKIINKFEKMGYHCKSWILNAMDYGVPQNRRRLFILGSKRNVTFKVPKSDSHKKITVKDAIADLPILSNGANVSWLKYEQEAISSYSKQMRGSLEGCMNHLVSRNSELILSRYSYIPQGGNWESIPVQLLQNYKDISRCHTGIYRRLIDNEPSVVIGNYRKNMLIHPTQDRSISVREAARIQSFPDTYEFKGSIGFQQQQVGNAVPPLLSRAVFSSLLSF